MKTVARLGAAGLICWIAVEPLLAQELEEIIVTATRREQSLQDIPISVTVATGEFIQQGGFADIEDLSEFLPNLTISDGFQGQTLLIRGIGTDTRNEAFEQAVAQFADGVYYGRDNLVLGGLFDLERVEVVRGPQPVFAGQSATAGAISSISRKPGDAFEGDVMLQYGADEERSLEAAFGGPVTDEFGIRVAGRYYDLPDAGYSEIVTGEKIGATENKSLRVTAAWAPTDRFDFTFKYEYQNSFQNGTPSEIGRCDLDFSTGNAGPLAPGVPALCALESALGLSNLSVYNRESHGGGTVDLWTAIDFVNANGASVMPFVPIPRGLNSVNEYNHKQTRETDADIYVGTFNWQIGDNTLSAITSYITFDKGDWLDPDESAFAVFTDHRTEAFEQMAQEIRLTSPLDRKFSWMVGAYWQSHEANLQINVHYPFVLGPPAPGFVTSSDGGKVTENSDWTSLFFTGTVNLTDAFRFNLGGRYQESRKKGVYTIGRALLPAGAAAFDPYLFQATPALDEDVNSDDFLPEVGFQWDPTSDMMVYLKYAEAFKAGGFVMNPPLGGVAPDPFTFLPEEASGYEVGLKGRFLDNRLQIDIALFDTDFKNLQVNSFNGVAGRFQVRNAAESNTNGIEVDGRFIAGERWSMGFNVGYNDAHYTYFPNGQCGPIQTREWVAAGNPPQTCTADFSGRRPFLGAEWQVGLQPQVRFQVGEFSARAGLNMTWIAGRDPFFTPPPGLPEDPLATIPDRHRFDLRVAFTAPSESWEVALYGRDITDEAAHIGGLQSGFFNQTSGTTNSEVHLYGISGKTFERGARWGVQANFFFGR